MENKVYYAKPIDGNEGIYEEHVRKCYEIAYAEIEQIREKLTFLLSELGINAEAYIRLMKIAVLFHDTGKLNRLFQQLMIKLIKKHPVRNSDYFRHELISCLMLICLERDSLESVGPPYHFYSILSHHKALTGDLRNFQREMCDKEWPMLENEEVEYMIKTIEKISGGEFSYNDCFKLPPSKYALSFFILFADKYLGARYFRDKDIHVIRTLYGLMKGFLHFCDWLGSSEINYKEICQINNVTPQVIFQKLKSKIETDGKAKYVPRDFHLKCMKHKGDAVVIAPTGSGKTEACLVWALNTNPRKIILLMPTMVTSNNLYERLCYYFSESLCGLSHSGAETYFAVKNEEEVYGIDKFKLLKQKAFMPAVMVSTVDQILTCGFNTGLWSLKEYALLGSAVIFDEIQAYEHYTLGLITAAIKKIKSLGGKVMVMSATMPRFLREHFLNLLGLPEAIVAMERMNIKRNRWVYIDNTVEEIRERVIREVKKGKKVAVIVNDIKTAKTEYEAYMNLLKEDDLSYKILCLHSEFAMIDRQEKERKLTDKKGDTYHLVIATQVIEVSLDISFEIMYSECAPIDSLVQRAGRCNRYGEFNDSCFYIFNASETSLKYVYKNQDEVMKRTARVIKSRQGILSEAQISDMIEEVYHDVNLYDDSFVEGEKLYSVIESKYGIRDVIIDEEDERLITRNNAILKVPVIPANQYMDKVIKLFEEKKYGLISLYEVPVKINDYNKLYRGKYCDNKYNLPIYAVGYSKEKGLYDDPFY
ncbi:MAG: CRISPR-associated helicase Cas3' [Clostridiaceae bacterium]|nr:CRISPR-associated helicase Cas3' [Clostridiaceae bacterium]